MGLRYRKSINLGGGARINISKSGIGYSWGGKGFRFTKTANGRNRATVRLPGTGLFYVTESSGKKKTSKRKPIRNSRARTAGDTSVTGGSLLFLAVIGLCVYVGIRVGSGHGLIAILGAVFICFVALAVLGAVGASLAQSRKTQKAAQATQDQGYLQALVNRADRCQGAISIARNPEAVQNSLKQLFSTWDELMTYSDEALKSVGMTKEGLRQKKAEMQSAVPALMERTQAPRSPLPPQPGEMAPSRQGLFPQEILMLSYAPTYKISGNQFPEFWRYKYSVTDPQGLLQSLCERGFLAVGDLRTTLSQLKVAELKAELKAVGAPTSGKKAELVERLLSCESTSALAEKYPSEYYVLTEKGTQELKENEYVPYLHRTNYMSVFGMNVLLSHDNPSHLGYRDILWREFNKYSMAHFKDCDYGLYRNSRLNMYQFLMEEKRYSQAFLMLCEVAAYDLNNLGNGEKIIDPDIEKILLEHTLRTFVPYDSWHLPPAIVRWMDGMREILNLSDADFRAALLENFEKFSLPRRVFTNEECAEIVMNEINDQPEKQVTIYHRAEQRVRAKLAEME